MTKFSIAIMGLMAVALVLMVVANVAEPKFGLADDAEIRVVMEWPTPEPTPEPTSTPRPPTLSATSTALRMAWLPNPPGGSNPCAQDALPINEDWVSDNDAAATTTPVSACGNAVQSAIRDGETGALGSGVIHYPRCAANTYPLGRYLLAVPEGEPHDYPQPTSLVVDGIDQLNAWVRQDILLRYPASDGITYRPYITAYLQTCHVWDGDRVDVYPRPMPTPRPGAS